LVIELSLHILYLMIFFFRKTFY